MGALIAIAGEDVAPSDKALEEIPVDLLPIYQSAASTCDGLDWTVLAAIHKVETSFGLGRATSSKGAQGPMQFMPSTWAAYGSVPRRFEDYTAMSVPSRQAWDGVEDCDVYLLLLGEHYGEPLPDTGKAPTEEEFVVARRRNIPILVFRKMGAEPDEFQQDFIKRVEEYATGRFRRSFEQPQDLLT